MAARGVVAVDMETAAVAAVCVGAQCPWSVFRGISDYAGEGLVDDALFAMTRPDGTADPDVIARYLEANPERKQVLVRLAHDTNLATEAAAAAAIDACAALQNPNRREPAQSCRSLVPTPVAEGRSRGREARGDHVLTLAAARPPALLCSTGLP